MNSERLNPPGRRRIWGPSPPRSVDQPHLRRSRPRQMHTSAALLAAALLLGATPSAWAGASLATSAEFPASLTTGQTGVPAAVSVTNASSGAQARQSITLSAISLVAGCATKAISGADCPTAAIDPGVLRPASAAGEANTGCAGATFAVVLVDATQGKYRLAPKAPVILGPPGSPTAACVIDVTVGVIAIPTRDADPAKPGRQTDEVAFARGSSADGQAAGAFATAQSTVAAVPSPAPVGQAIAVGDELPTAAYSPTTYTPTPGQSVSFDAGASRDPDGILLSLRWTWGDGTPDGSGVTATHVFATPGVRSVGLHVTDSDRRTGAASHTIAVGP